MRKIRQHAEPINSRTVSSYFNPIDAKTIGVFLPYSTLKYLQQKARNQVPAATSDTLVAWVRRPSCPPEVANNTYLDILTETIRRFPKGWFDMPSY